MAKWEKHVIISYKVFICSNDISYCVVHANRLARKAVFCNVSGRVLKFIKEDAKGKRQC